MTVPRRISKTILEAIVIKIGLLAIGVGALLILTPVFGDEIVVGGTGLLLTGIGLLQAIVEHTERSIKHGKAEK